MQVTLAKAEAVLETFTTMIDSCEQLTGIKDKALQVLGGLHTLNSKLFSESCSPNPKPQSPNPKPGSGGAARGVG